MLHFRAWELGIKSLYYLRSKSVQRAGFAGGVEADNTAEAPKIELADARITTNAWPASNRHPGESRDLGETRRDFSSWGPGFPRDDGSPCFSGASEMPETITLGHVLLILAAAAMVFALVQTSVYLRHQGAGPGTPQYARRRDGRRYAAWALLVVFLLLALGFLTPLGDMAIA